MAVRTITMPTRLDEVGIQRLLAALGPAGSPSMQDRGDLDIIVLRGEGPFCLGLDLRSATQGAAPSQDLDGFVQLLIRLRTGPEPVVALVEGDCLAGGLGIAAAADLIIATTQARFGLPEALFGMVPAMVMPLLQERVSAQRLRLLALRGTTIDAEEALRLGLIDLLVEPPQAEARLRAELRQLRRASPVSVSLLRRAPDLGPAMRQGSVITGGRLADPAVAQAVARFEAGEPPWSRP